jgi:hypothetical protein
LWQDLTKVRQDGAGDDAMPFGGRVNAIGLVEAGVAADAFEEEGDEFRRRFPSPGRG